MTTMNQFINRYGIKFKATWAQDNPNMTDPIPGASHWRCTFSIGRRRLTTPFSMGPAHSHEPQAAEVLDCIASDVSGLENAGSFEDWCSDYGYDTDSRKAEKTYNIIKRQAEKLRDLLNEARYEELLWHTERE
jgi:hypothetical protein